MLLDDNFGSIVNAISEGRQLFKNLKASFNYLLMVHMPFVFSAALIPLFGYPLLYYPTHIVMIELIIHPTAMLVFQDVPISKKLEPVVKQKQVHFFSKSDWRKLMIVGIFSTLMVMLSFIYIYETTSYVEYARSYALALLFFTSAALTAGLGGFAGWSARVMVVSPIVFSILFIQLPRFAAFLSLAPLHGIDWLLVALSGAITCLATSLL